MKNIGVVGKGFVGSAVAHGFSPAVGYNANVLVYDKDPLKSVDSLDDVVNKSDFIFVSVPTPSNKDGSISLDILYACISEIEDALKDNSPVVLVRSTVVPGTCEDIQSKFPKLRIVFNPEFLTERSATFDFLSQTRYILGGKDKDTSEVADLYLSLIHI